MGKKSQEVKEVLSYVKPGTPGVEVFRLQMIRNYIDANKKTFKAGNTVNTKELNQLFGITLSAIYEKGMKPSDIVAAYKKHHNQQRAWQNRINRLLARRGLYLSMRGETYTLKTKVQTLQKVTGFLTDAARKKARSFELKQGILNYGSKYSHVTDEEIMTIWKAAVEKNRPTTTGVKGDTGRNTADDYHDGFIK